jgi:predicted nucleic acid-binding protein
MQHLEEQNLRLAAPTLFHYKIVSVVRKHVFRATLTSDEAETILTDLLLIPVQLMLDDALIRRAYELATQFNRPTAYDAQYLAVAERLNCDFWTADEKLFNAVRDGLNWVKWVGNFESETRQ